MKEEWRSIKGTNGKYSVSNMGRVKNTGSNPRWSGKILNPTEKTKTCGVRISYSMNGKPITKYVSTLVMEAFIGPKEIGYIASHKDKNTSNNCSENLKYVKKNNTTRPKRYFLKEIPPTQKKEISPKKIPGTYGEYVATTKGNVFRIMEGGRLREVKGWDRGENKSTMIGISHNSKEIRKTSQQNLIWETFVGEIKKNEIIVHKDKDNRNNSLNNLEKISIYMFNLRNCATKKLNMAQVKELKEMHKNKHGVKEISKKYNIAEATVRQILSERSWTFTE